MEATCVHQEMSLISIYIMARSGEATPEGGSVEKRKTRGPENAADSSTSLQKLPFSLWQCLSILS